MMTVFAANTRISVPVITYKDEHKTFFIPLPDTGCILLLIYALVPSGGTFRVVVSPDLKFIAKLVGSRRKMKIISLKIKIISLRQCLKYERLIRTGGISPDMRGLSKA